MSRYSYLETICAQILADSQNLHETVVVVPSYSLVSTISATLHKLSSSRAIMLPKFFTLEALYSHLRMTKGTALFEAAAAEKMVILSSVLKSTGISLCALDEYFQNIENYTSTQKHPHAFLKVRDSYLGQLKAKGIAPPVPLGTAEIKWLVEAFAGKLFIIPTLENFDDLTLANANPLPLPQFNNCKVTLELEDLAIKGNPYLAPKPEIQIIEYANKFELARFALMFQQDYVIVESEDIRDLLYKELASGSYKNLVDTYEFKLFYAIAKLAFDYKNLDHTLELATNPVSVLHNHGTSWLKNNNDLRSARSIMMSALSAHSKVIERISKINICYDYASALVLHNSIFLKLVAESKCDPHTFFELQQFVRELGDYLAENLCKLDKEYLTLLFSLAKRHPMAASNQPEIIGLKQADYIDFENIVLIENGLSKLEKAAQEEGDQVFAYLCTRYVWLMKAKKITVLRANGPSTEESIFYSLLKSSHKPIIHKPPHLRKSGLPQPAPDVGQELRPKQYSVTAIGKLLADPYCYYAEYILRLRQMDRIWEASENRVFGILVHNVLAKLDDSKAIEDALSAHELTDSAKLIWQEKLTTAVEFMKSYYKANPVRKYFTEHEGEATVFDDITIAARADRIDLSLAGEAAVIDIKTGYVPAQSEVDNGTTPQLAIESWILSKSGFAGVAAADITAKYFSINGRVGSQSVKDIKIDASTTESSLMALFERFYLNAECYFATPVSVYSSYTHLKRLSEWLESV